MTAKELKEKVTGFKVLIGPRNVDKLHADIDSIMETVNKAWLMALHNNGIVDVTDAEGANKQFLLEAMEEELKKLSQL